MGEYQLASVKKNPLEGGLVRRAIKRVAGHRMSDGRQMHANLVGTPRGDANLEQREVWPLLDDAIIGNRWPALPGPSGHFHAVAAVAADRHFEPPPLDPLHDHWPTPAGGNTPVHKRLICLPHLPQSKLPRQADVSRVGFGCQQDSAGPAVQAMHNAWAQFTSHCRQPLEAMQERVYQRALCDPRAGMHRHAGGLVHRHQIVVFVENLERNLLGKGARRGGWSERPHFDLLASVQAGGGFRNRAVQQYMTRLDPLLQPRAAGFLEMARQKLVQALAGIGGGGPKYHSVVV